MSKYVADVCRGLFRPHPVWVLALACVSACHSGCVYRRMTIRSNPPGAVVYVDDYEIGSTPVSTDFTYYGTRKIRLVKDGYETLTLMQPVPIAWYQIPPLDFVSENLVPGKIRDHRTFTYQLMPQMVVPTDQLLQRAEELRSRAQPSGPAAPASFVPPPVGAGSFAPPGPPASGGMPVHPLPPSSGQVPIGP